MLQWLCLMETWWSGLTYLFAKEAGRKPSRVRISPSPQLTQEKSVRTFPGLSLRERARFERTRDYEKEHLKGAFFCSRRRARQLLVVRARFESRSMSTCRRRGEVANNLYFCELDEQKYLVIRDRITGFEQSDGKNLFAVESQLS